MHTYGWNKLKYAKCLSTRLWVPSKTSKTDTTNQLNIQISERISKLQNRIHLAIYHAGSIRTKTELVNKENGTPINCVTDVSNPAIFLVNWTLCRWKPGFFRQNKYKQNQGIPFQYTILWTLRATRFVFRVDQVPQIWQVWCVHVLCVCVFVCVVLCYVVS